MILPSSPLQFYTTPGRRQGQGLRRRSTSLRGPLTASLAVLFQFSVMMKATKKMWVDRSERVEVPLPSTAERFPLVPTDISGILNTSPTESPGVCLHYVKKGLRAQKLKRVTPERPIPFNITAGMQDSGSLSEVMRRPRRFFNTFASIRPHFRHHCRLVSWVTIPPRSAIISSLSRKRREKRKESQTAWLMIAGGKRKPL